MYYSGNRYLTHEEQEVNAQYIYEYLTAENWTVEAISGLLGNMQTESTINPAIWQGLIEDNYSGGYGLVQWTPATKYFNWCSENLLIPSEMDSNLLRILYEVENGIQWGKDSLGKLPPYSFEEFTQSTESPYTLAMNFLHHYERPKVYNQPKRGEQAQAWYEFLTGLPPIEPNPEPLKKRKSKVFLFLPKRRLFY